MRLKQEQMLQPYYEVYFNNSTKPLHDKLKAFITQIEFEESDEEADTARITVSDVDFVFSNSLNLTKKMPVKVRMGFVGNIRTMINGTVAYIEGDYAEDGVPVLTIGIVDSTNAMTTTKRSRKWKNQRSSDVVIAIARQYGYTPVVTTTSSVVEEITQEDETDAQVLAKLADDEGFQFYVVPDTKKLYFGERVTDGVPVATLNYKIGDQTIMYFRPNFTEKNKPNNVASNEGGVSDVNGASLFKTTSALGGDYPSTQSTIQFSAGSVSAIGSTR